MRNMFGWDLPPGCGVLPGEESIPPSCEVCPEDKYENSCPGIDNCIDVLLDSHPSCCIEHKYDMIDGECGECMSEMWMELDLDLSKSEDRIRALKAGFEQKSIEIIYLRQMGIKKL